jgi:hypothetical protein
VWVASHRDVQVPFVFGTAQARDEEENFFLTEFGSFVHKNVGSLQALPLLQVVRNRGELNSGTIREAPRQGLNQRRATEVLIDAVRFVPQTARKLQHRECTTNDEHSCSRVFDVFQCLRQTCVRFAATGSTTAQQNISRIIQENKLLLEGAWAEYDLFVHSIPLSTKKPLLA